MTTYFISDLHLTPERPQTTRMFFDFLSGPAGVADALYILGDLFEFWIGDDAAEHIGHADIVAALRQVTERTPVYFMCGNRDFLVGEEFARRTGCRLLADPAVIMLGGRKVLLMHGDSMCTDDTAHQQFRSLVQDPEWRRRFLDSPVRERLAAARNARSESALHTSMTSMDIMDVNPQTVENEVDRHQADVLVHGHTHRPGIHTVRVNGRAATRIVLGDWYEQESTLRYEDGAFYLSARNADYPPVC